MIQIRASMIRLPAEILKATGVVAKVGAVLDLPIFSKELKTVRRRFWEFTLHA